jgi:hypothetical protein
LATTTVEIQISTDEIIRVEVSSGIAVVDRMSESPFRTDVYSSPTAAE